MADRQEVEGSSEGRATLERTFIKIVLKELLIGTCKLNLSLRYHFYLQIHKLHLMAHFFQMISDMTFQFQHIHTLGFVVRFDLPSNSNYYVTNFGKVYSHWSIKFSTFCVSQWVCNLHFGVR